MSPGFARLASVPMLLAGLLVLAPAAPAGAAADPDFSNVADILQGRRTLLPVDDIVVNFNGIGQPPIATILQTTGDAIGTQIPYTVPAPGPHYVSLTAAVRMFNLPRDVVVTLLAGAANLHDQAGGFSQSFPNAVSPILLDTAHATTDLVGNGFAAIAFIASIPQEGPVPNVPYGAIGTVMAANVNDLSLGFFYGTPVPLPPAGGNFGIAAGDFDGDGSNEIAVAYEASCVTPDCPSDVVVAIFKPNVTTDGQGNVTSLTLQQAGSVTIPIPAGGPGSMALTAGRYSGRTRRELVLVYSGGPPTTVQPISVSPTSDPVQVALTLAAPLTLDQHNYAFISAQSGPLDFFENTDQAVLLLQRPDVASGTLAVLTFDSQLNASLASSLTVPAQAQLPLAIALGNFDQPDTDVKPLALEIAALLLAGGPDCASGFALMVQIYRVDPPSNFALSAGASAPLPSTCATTLDGAGLVTGDTQGRSLVLGPPSKLTAQHVQPELILGAPPMHVDYVTPANSSRPVVLNLSAVPQGFNSSYRTAVSNQTQSSRQATTSYTNAVKASVSAGVKFGVPLAGSVTATVGASAGFMHEKSIQKRYGQYASTAFDASTTTGFDDQVWFTSKTHYIYVYPVVGQTACPAENPGCTPSERVPVLVMFSGPTVNLQESVGGANLEWYQPIHEVGSVFSYPWSLAQLQAAEGDVNLLTSADPDGFATDGSTHTAMATWAGQQSSTVTSGSVSNISWGASASVTEKAGIFGGITGQQSFSYNGSKAISTLNTMTTQVGESTGIGIVKPGTFPSPPLYQYPIFPYIFGDNPVPGTLQKLDVGTQVQTSGILRAAYTANPTDPSAGAWWQGTYSAPDVALNHPSRWSIELFTPSAPQPNCIPTAAFSRNQACITFNPPEPDVWTSEFHYLKGLLITPAGVDGEGPQLTQAAAGQPLLLRARVYNYSLADMPGDSTVVVQFYGQPWDPTRLVPAGNAFLIEQVELAPLPAFNSVATGGTTPNWAIASTTGLDTASYADQYLVFWVLVYMRDAQGQLVGEMPGHGLASVPPVLSSIGAATPFLESHSNNVGLYKSTFYVAPQGGGVSVEPRQARLGLGPVEASAPRVLLGDKIAVSGLVESQDAVDGVSVVFRDGTAAGPGKLFDVEQVAHVRAGGAHLVKTVHRPTTCGTRVLSLEVLDTAAAGQATVEVTLDFGREIGELIALTSRLPHGDMFLEPLLAARAAFDARAPDLGAAALERFRGAVQASLQAVPFSATLVSLVEAKVDRMQSCASASIGQVAPPASAARGSRTGP